MSIFTEQQAEAAWWRRGWEAVPVAAFLMMATLPGRTHGLGLVTTRLVEDFAITDLHFANLNFWATLIGATFCWPCGKWIDRFGLRLVAAVILALTSLAVLGMSECQQTWSLAVSLILVRGFAQGMLSVVSITLVGKWFGKQVGPAMGIYAVLLSLFLGGATAWLSSAVAAVGWRQAWATQGWFLLASVPLVALLTRDPVRPLPGLMKTEPTALAAGFAEGTKHSVRPEANAYGSRNQPFSSPLPTTKDEESRPSATLSDALKTTCFWVFTLSISFFGLISSGLTLFSQSALAERGFSESVYHDTLVFGFLVGMVSNLISGVLAKRVPLTRLLSVALALLAISLAWFPFCKTISDVYVYVTVMGIAGGMLTVLFFTVWRQAFGKEYLGRIQAAAQSVTVFASALGPVMVSLSEASTGSYATVFFTSSVVSLGLAVIAWFTFVPNAIVRIVPLPPGQSSQHV